MEFLKIGTHDDSLLDNEAFNAFLEKCLEELPERWRTLVKLTYLEEKNLQKFVRTPIFLRLIIGRYYSAVVYNFVNAYSLIGLKNKMSTFNRILHILILPCS
jgi:hypothetical protein